MSIDWSLIGQPVDIGAHFREGYEHGQQERRQREAQGALAALVRDPTNVEAQNALASFDTGYATQLIGQRGEAAHKQQIGRILTNPDLNASRQEAREMGDVDLLKQIDGLEANHKKQLSDMYKAAAPIAYQALKLPYEQRKAYIESVRPELSASGWTDELLNNFDPTDEGLTAVVHSNMTVEQAMGRDKVDYKEVGPGARLVPFDSTGRPMTSDAGGSRTAGMTTPGMQTTPGFGAGHPAVPDGSGVFNPKLPSGATVTSGYRTPEHNRDVGGVRNSYHTRKDANGNPMAFDIVPPQGMSMEQLHAEAMRLNPGLDVINEGDHVHLEPKPGGASRPGLAEVRRHAQEAIAAGADPVAVKARAAEMGVTL